MANFGQLNGADTEISTQNPLPVTGTVTELNASVGATGSSVPLSATYVGINNGGNLTGWNGAVTQSGSWSFTVSNATLAVTQSGAWSVSISNATLAVTQSGAWTVGVSGTVTVAGTVSISGTVTTTGTVAVSGTVATQSNRSATGTETNVASSASSVTLLASNANRLGAVIVNDSTQILYVLLQTGGTASATVYTFQMAPAGIVPSILEIPFGYTGAVIGIWAAANGSARVTEFTA